MKNKMQPTLQIANPQAQRQSDSMMTTQHQSGSMPSKNSLNANSFGVTKLIFCF